MGYKDNPSSVCVQPWEGEVRNSDKNRDRTYLKEKHTRFNENKNVNDAQLENIYPPSHLDDTIHVNPFIISRFMESYIFRNVHDIYIFELPDPEFKVGKGMYLVPSKFSIYHRLFLLWVTRRYEACVECGGVLSDLPEHGNKAHGSTVSVLAVPKANPRQRIIDK